MISKVSVSLLLAITSVVLGNKIHWQAEPNLKDLALKLNLKSFVYLMKVAKLDGILTSPQDNYTLFVPTQQAWLRLPVSFRQRLIAEETLAAQLLNFHLMKGRNYSSSWTNDMVFETGINGDALNRINKYNITKNDEIVYTLMGRTLNAKMLDQNASNGVINVVETVVWPIPTEPAGESIKEQKDNLTQFYKAISLLEVRLDKTLNSGTWTVFAPTDEAFKKYPNFKKDWEGFLHREKLLELLKFHMIESTTIYTQGINNMTNVTTYNGKKMTLITENGKFIVSDGTSNATITRGNIPVTNGVIHMIDNIFIPTS